jgi:hypothetical protein
VADTVADGLPAKFPYKLKDLDWASWTCIFGYPVIGGCLFAAATSHAAATCARLFGKQCAVRDCVAVPLWSPAAVFDPFTSAGALAFSVPDAGAWDGAATVTSSNGNSSRDLLVTGDSTGAVKLFRYPAFEKLVRGGAGWCG